MKNILLIFLAFISFVSCSDDDKTHSTIYHKDVMNNKWIANIGDKTYSVSFDDDKICEYSSPSIEDNSIQVTINYTYQVEPGDILLLFDNQKTNTSKGYFKDGFLYLDLIKGLYYPFKKVE